MLTIIIRLWTRKLLLLLQNILQHVAYIAEHVVNTSMENVRDANRTKKRHGVRYVNVA